MHCASTCYSLNVLFALFVVSFVQVPSDSEQLLIESLSASFAALSVDSCLDSLIGIVSGFMNDSGIQSQVMLQPDEFVKQLLLLLANKFSGITYKTLEQCVQDIITFKNLPVDNMKYQLVNAKICTAASLLICNGRARVFCSFIDCFWYALPHFSD